MISVLNRVFAVVFVVFQVSAYSKDFNGLSVQDLDDFVESQFLLGESCDRISTFVMNKASTELKKYLKQQKDLIQGSSLSVEETIARLNAVKVIEKATVYWLINLHCLDSDLRISFLGSEEHDGFGYITNEIFHNKSGCFGKHKLSIQIGFLDINHRKLDGLVPFVLNLSWFQPRYSGKTLNIRNWKKVKLGLNLPLFEEEDNPFLCRIPLNKPCAGRLVKMAGIPEES